MERIKSELFLRYFWGGNFFMKKFFVGILMFVLSALSFAEAAYHIGVVSGTVSQSEDSLRGAEAIMAKYGAADKGGMVVYLSR